MATLTRGPCFQDSVKERKDHSSFAYNALQIFDERYIGR